MRYIEPFRNRFEAVNELSKNLNRKKKTLRDVRMTTRLANLTCVCILARFCPLQRCAMDAEHLREGAENDTFVLIPSCQPQLVFVCPDVVCRAGAVSP